MRSHRAVVTKHSQFRDHHISLQIKKVDGSNKPNHTLNHAQESGSGRSSGSSDTLGTFKVRNTAKKSIQNPKFNNPECLETFPGVVFAAAPPPTFDPDGLKNPSARYINSAIVHCLYCEIHGAEHRLVNRCRDIESCTRYTQDIRYSRRDFDPYPS